MVPPLGPIGAPSAVSISSGETQGGQQYPEIDRRTEPRGISQTKPGKKEEGSPDNTGNSAKRIERVQPAHPLGQSRHPRRHELAENRQRSAHEGRGYQNKQEADEKPDQRQGIEVSLQRGVQGAIERREHAENERESHCERADAKLQETE